MSIKNWLFSDSKKGPNLSIEVEEADESLYAEWDDGDDIRDEQIDVQYHTTIVRKITFMVCCVVALFVVAGLTITYGEFDISFTEVYQIIWEHIRFGPPTDPIEYLEDHVVWELRLPRVVVAIIAGFGLAVAGAVMQSTLKNPMADSYTTGVSSGAVFGATLSVVMGLNVINSDIGMLLNAFLFSLAPTALIVVISSRKKMTATTMILSGLAIMYIFSAFTTMMKLMADPDSLASLYRWQVGSLNNMTWDEVPLMLAVTAAGSIAIMLLSNRINVLSSGDENAKSLGIDAQKLRIICLVIVSLITASIVCYTGTIGFVGLVVPHIARMFIGSDNKYLIPASALAGALLMLTCDILGRVIIAPAVLEVGVVTAFIGGPMFLYLILRQRKEVWS